MKSNPHSKEQIWKEAIEFARNHRTDHLITDADAIEIGLPGELSDEEKSKLDEYIRSLMPWRKGPFLLFGREILASWKSHLKWDRVVRYMDDAEDKIIADVGANNGYYMFRMLSHRPKLVIGMDPVDSVYKSFEFLHGFHPHPALRFEKKGWEHLAEYENYFDIIFLMGILYHHTDPVEILRLCKRALKKGGQLVLETMGVRTEDLVSPLLIKKAEEHRSREGRKSDQRGDADSLCLFPSGKYAGANAIWFLPTPPALVSMVRRSGLREAELHDIHFYEDEHVQTELSPMPSLRDFLDPENPGLTIEGYPAPVRIHLSARK